MKVLKSRRGIGKITFPLAIVFSSIGLAAPALATLEWDANQFTVTKVQTYKTGRIWVGLSGNVNAGGCVNDDEVQVATDASEQGRDLMMRAILAAQLSGRAVKVRVEASQGICYLHEIAVE